ncbi:MAG: phosphatase PAP2 family protein [Halothermotrichaceae bacterium]
MDFIVFLQTYSNPTLDNIFELITMIGEDIFFILILSIFFWCVDKQFSYKLGFAYLSGGILSTSIKEVTAIPRIIGEEGIRSLRLHTAGGYSFPSGHTVSATLLLSSLMTKVKRKWFYFLAGLMIVLVAISRMYLGVHRLIDVIGGLLIGILWFFFVNYIFKISLTKKSKKILLIIVIPALLGLFFIKTYTYYKAVGTLFSFFIGYLIETEYINFKVKTTLFKQFIKIILGLLILLCIKIYVKELMPEGILFSDFFRYFLMGIWLTLGAPLLFKKVNLASS